MNRMLGALRRRALGLGALAATGVLAVTLATIPSASGAFTARIANSTDTAGTATYFTCTDSLAADKSAALFQWPLADAAGSTSASDISGNGHTGTYQGTVATTSTAPLACPRDVAAGASTAWTLDGSTNYAVYPVQQTNPQVFTIEIWFRTTVAGGKLIGFGANATGANSTYDRHLFLTTTGAVSFGVYSGGAHVVTSTSGGYADGKWHYAAATLSSAGMALYVDAKPVVTGATTSAESGSGYWRVGYDSISTGWSSPQTKLYFQGDLRYAAVYTSALSAAQIRNHWAAGT